MIAHVELSSRAVKDLRRLDEATHRRIDAVLRDFQKIPLPPNLDTKQLEGRAPWQRARIGDLRIIYREFTPQELAGRTGERSGKGYLIARVVPRRDLEKAIRAMLR